MSTRLLRGKDLNRRWASFGRTLYAARAWWNYRNWTTLWPSANSPLCCQIPLKNKPLLFERAWLRMRVKAYIAIHPSCWDPVLCMTSREIVHCLTTFEKLDPGSQSTVEFATVAEMHINCFNMLGAYKPLVHRDTYGNTMWIPSCSGIVRAFLSDRLTWVLRLLNWIVK